MTNKKRSEECSNCHVIEQRGIYGGKLGEHVRCIECDFIVVVGKGRYDMTKKEFIFVDSRIFSRT